MKTIVGGYELVEVDGILHYRPYRAGDDKDPDTPHCTCDPNSRFVSCGIHVSCEDNCKALIRPETPEEIKLALEDWEDHGHLGTANV